MIFEITHSGITNSFVVTADRPNILNVVEPVPVTFTVAVYRDGRDGSDAVPAILDGGLLF